MAGYALSKFIGVKAISEIAPVRRALAILGLIALAWLALIAFALLPAPWNVAAMFFNGLPLGMIWGLVWPAWPTAWRAAARSWSTASRRPSGSRLNTRMASPYWPAIAPGSNMPARTGCA